MNQIVITSCEDMSAAEYRRALSPTGYASARDEDGFLLWLIVIGGALIVLGILITLLRAGAL